MEGRSTKRLVLVPFPSPGHLNPMIHLASLLRCKGFPVTIAHPELNFPDPSHNPDLAFSMLPCGRASPGYPSSNNIIDVIFSVNHDCREPFVSLLSEIIKGGSSACVIYDQLLYFPEEAAIQLSLPSLRLHTSSFTFCLALNIFPKLLDQGLIPPDNSTLLNPVKEIHPLRFKDLPIGNYDLLDAVMKSFAAVNPIRSSSAIIWNSMEFLEEASLAQVQKLYGVPIYTICPLHKLSPFCSPFSHLFTEDTSCLDWLDKQAPGSVLYVSLGSIASLTDEKVEEMAWGLANSKQPFLWVLRPGSTQESKWMELLESGFLENVGERGRIVRWAPQREVLAHNAVGGFWSHCGWNSIIESIAEGVPIICQPSFADQIMNARFLSWVWKIGIEMEGKFNRMEIERTIRSLMTQEEGRKLRQTALKLKEEVERSVQDDGATSNSLNELIKHVLSL